LDYIGSCMCVNSDFVKRFMTRIGSILFYSREYVVSNVGIPMGIGGRMATIR